MSFDPYEFDNQYEMNTPTQTVGQYTANTFVWMFVGLLVTFGIAVTLSMTGGIFVVFSIPGIHIGLLLAQLFTVIVLSARIQKMAVGTARVMFIGYSALTGVTFSTIFWAYGLQNVIWAFGMTAAYFGVMAVFGYVTKVDLSRIRNILISGVIFLIIMNVVMMFTDLRAMDRIVCLIGIAIFLAYTAYDVQKIRSYYTYYAHDGEMLAKASVFSALQLYLDFINLFLYLLRFMGNRRN